MNMLEISQLKPGVFIHYPDIEIAIDILKVNRNTEELTVKIIDTDEEFTISFNEATDYEKVENIMAYKEVYNGNTRYDI